MDGWVKQGVLHLAPVGPDKEPDLRFDAQPCSNFYLSIVTFTTLGFGDFQPQPFMRLYTAGEAVLGYIFLGLLVGALIDRARKLARADPAPEDAGLAGTGVKDVISGRRRRPNRAKCRNLR